MATHLAFPLQVTSRGLATVAHDSSADVEQSVRLLLNTRPGERRSVPDYGLPDPLFGQQVDPQDVGEVISEWEDRADVTELDISALLARITPGGALFGDGTYGDGIYGGHHAL